MINYAILQDSIDHYSSFGFQRIESPWTVSEQISNITKPEDRIAFQLKHNDKCLVGSGEQSFLYLYLKGFLPKGRYQTITPCYRLESFDFLHTKYFMKNELIETETVNDFILEQIIQNSLNFFKKYLPADELCVVDNRDGSFDINYAGNELGSYGIRNCEFLEWIYGTGCAEPRLSSLINLYGISSKRN